jgi:hypothetical protein
MQARANATRTATAVLMGKGSERLAATLAAFEEVCPTPNQRQKQTRRIGRRILRNITR